jgi:cardiolipin synthase
LDRFGKGTFSTLQYGLIDFWFQLTAAIDVGLAVAASGHAVLYKRDVRATIAWVGLIWLVPLAGSGLYVWLGINRIERRARSRRARRPELKPHSTCESGTLQQHADAFGTEHANLLSLVKLVNEVTKKPLLAGNRIEPLIDGDQAFPAMIDAIDAATLSISLSTYIFDQDRVGDRFVAALQRAVTRHVDVRVLIDDMGARYSWPRITRAFRHTAVKWTTFMPPLIPWRFQYTNLRTHRKILVVDGRVGFTGGMNIREGHCLSMNPRHPVRDLHFRVQGPVVSQMQDVFADDWAFCTGECLQGGRWFPDIEPQGSALARGLPDGPDEDFESFRMTLFGAIASAESSILIVTPYFLPDAALMTALNVAAMRGLAVDIVLPERNNITLVQWAAAAQLWQVVERGCRVWQSPPPFDHTKLMVVDGLAVFVGSANWDPRSLRLNFEFNLECYDRELSRSLTEFAQARIRSSRQVSLAELNNRSLPVRLRDGIARLCSPYL